MEKDSFSEVNGYGLSLRKLLKFSFVFICLFALQEYLYFLIPDEYLIRTFYYQGIVSPCAMLINAFASHENVQATKNLLSSSLASLEIVRGCDGAGTIFLLTSAVISFPASLKYKLIGVGIGFIVLFVVNLIRVTALYFISAYQPHWFSLVHSLIAPTLVILIGCVYFSFWIGLSNK